MKDTHQWFRYGSYYTHNFIGYDWTMWSLPMLDTGWYSRDSSLVSQIGYMALGPIQRLEFTCKETAEELSNKRNKWISSGKMRLMWIEIHVNFSLQQWPLNLTHYTVHLPNMIMAYCIWHPLAAYNGQFLYFRKESIQNNIFIGYWVGYWKQMTGIINLMNYHKHLAKCWQTSAEV